MTVYLLAVTGGAATLAAWICVRAPRIVPTSTTAVSVWVAVALGSSIAAQPLVHLTTRELGAAAAALLVVLPSGVCVFLAIGFATRVVVRGLELTD
jgi:hypothetical protein